MFVKKGADASGKKKLNLDEELDLETLSFKNGQTLNV